VKVSIICKDGVKGIYHINPKNYDEKRMEKLDGKTKK